MDFSLLIKHLDVIFREVWQRKFLCLFSFAAMSFIVLIIGMFWPSKFEATATIFADNQNILKPLLHDQAAQSNVQDQTKVVRDMMHSPRILNKVVEQVFGAGSFESAQELGQLINTIRAKLLVQSLGAGYIKISYSDKTSMDAYNVINTVVDLFIKASSDEQKSESREAFLFIDNQVSQYKDQLVLAEQRLKDFRAVGFDGRDTDVDTSIARLREQIEQLKISIDEDHSTVDTLKKQLANETEFSSKKFKADVYSDRLTELEARKATLLMSYTEDYPDVVSLSYQIDDIRNAIKESAEDDAEGAVQAEDDVVLNPLYQELRSRLSFVSADINAKEKRLAALDGLLSNEFERRKRIAERGAEESELTRDYNVTRRIYEDMLERKEMARLSMTLNIEGQGVTYRVQDPALPPVNPTGLRFLHFVLLGPFLGVFCVLGFIVLYVMLDSRIRFPEQLAALDVTTLAVVPHLRTPFTARVLKFDLIMCIVLGSLIMAVYIGLAYADRMGLL